MLMWGSVASRLLAASRCEGVYMRHIPARSLGLVCLLALTLGMTLSGCGTSPSTTLGHEVATSTATTAPTATNDPLPQTATTDPTSVELAGCPVLPALAPVRPQYVGVGSLQVSIPLFPPGLNHPGELMPNNEPNAPYRLAASAVANYRPNPPVNPSLSSGYILQVCNQTGASETLTGLSVTIASFTPSSGPVTVWHVCQDGPYDAATKQTTSGCGGGIGGVDFLSATLPSDRAGATAPVIGVSLPLTLDPNKSIAFDIVVNGLTSQGTYALTFGTSAAGAAPARLAPSDGAFLIVPSASVWTGTACQAPAMQAQIPATSQDTYYVCPPAS
jgi:hypothetical protein